MDHNVEQVDPTLIFMQNINVIIIIYRSLIIKAKTQITNF